MTLKRNVSALLMAGLIASPGQLGTDRDQGLDTSVAAPNARQGRAATMLERGRFGLMVG
jgi:hypothetical protein